VRGVDLLEASFQLLSGGKLNPSDWKVNPNAQPGFLGFFLQPPHERLVRSTHTVPQEASYIEWYYPDGEIVRPVNGLIEKVGYYITRGN
jgi:hypothetical protein